MTLLILGLILWAFAHLAKRLVPGFHRSLKGAERPMVTGLLVVALVLMVIGYRMADGAVFWGRNAALVGINNLLMLVSVYLFAASGMKTALARKMRHPMLTGVLVWSVAHLLVNGDTPSFVLFGGMRALGARRDRGDQPRPAALDPARGQTREIRGHGAGRHADRLWRDRGSPLPARLPDLRLR